MSREILQRLHDLLPKEGSTEFLAGASHMLSTLDDMLSPNIDEVLRRVVPEMLTILDRRYPQGIINPKTVCGNVQDRIMDTLVQDGLAAGEVQGVHVDLVESPDATGRCGRLTMHVQVYMRRQPTIKFIQSIIRDIDHDIRIR